MMRYANRIFVKVFAKPEEDVEAIRGSLIKMFPFEVKLKTRKAQGFTERMILIFEVDLEKISETNAFLKSFLGLFSDAQRELILSQAESRLDDRLNFFIRIDKCPWIERGKVFLTDSGDCYHVRISVAAFPHKRGVALDIIHRLLSGSI